MMSMDIYGSTNDIQVQTSTMFYAISFTYIKGFKIQMIWKTCSQLIFTSLQIMDWESLNTNTQSKVWCTRRIQV